jgi:uncharacterized repeat protein (TIGR03803 family)
MIRSTAARYVSAFALTVIAALWVPAWAGGAHAQSIYAVIHSFAGPPSDGSQVFRDLGVIQGADGALFGMTHEGGSSVCFPFPSGSCGTVFRMGPDGSGFVLLHQFTSGAMDGTHPFGRLIQGPDGTLYGTTHEGGSSAIGSIFQMAPDGSGFKLLHSFDGAPTDGQGPTGSLIQGADGTLYGMTESGGAANGGTVFEISPDGSGFMLLHSFTGGPLDGANPGASLIQGADGTLYGTTQNGGPGYLGTVFQIGADGSGFQLLHSFTGGLAEPAVPIGLTQGPDGTLFGTTALGGGPGCTCGTVFQMAPDGSGFTILHSFTHDPADGEAPSFLIQGVEGTLYGTTARGGAGNGGTVFQIALDGSGFTLLHSFTILPADGGYGPVGGVIQGPDGTLYGTTAFGGAAGFGVAFALSPAAAVSRVTLAFPHSRR